MAAMSNKPSAWWMRGGAGPVIVAVALSLAGCTTWAPQAAVTGEEVTAFGRIVADLSHPSMQGRGAGTEGLDRAKDYLIAKFDEIGLEPAFRPGDGEAEQTSSQTERSYTQPFDIHLSPQVTNARLELLDSHGEQAHEATNGTQFSVLGFSAAGQFVGSAVFVGYGIVDEDHRYDSYGDADRNELLGKVAIAFRYEPQDEAGKSLWAGRNDDLLHSTGRWTQAAGLVNKAKWAAQRGAVALLVVNPPSQDEGDLKSTKRSMASEEAVIPVVHISSSLFHEMLEAADEGPPQWIARQWQHDADGAQGSIVPLSKLVLRGHIEIERRRVSVANVAGFLPGAGSLADEVVVIGAHYDHLGFGEIGSLAGVEAIHPGADDNASGTAGLVLLAKRYRDRATTASTGRDGYRTLLFIAFSGEERGLLGSTHLVKQIQDLGLGIDQVVAMVNMDMIGRMSDEKLYVLGTGTGDRWAELVEAANERVGLAVKNQAEPFGGSDHVAFHHRRIPALHFFTGAHEDYHRPSDTADKVNRQGAVRVVNLIDAVLEPLWTGRDRVNFQSDSLSGSDVVDTAHASGGGGAYLGVMPDYVSLDGQDGCALASVIPGSPAQKAGLLTDDVIVTWDGQPVRGVHGLSRMLRDSRPGQQVTLKVFRRTEPTDQQPGDAESDPSSDDPAVRPLVEVTVELGQRRRPVKTLE